MLRSIVSSLSLAALVAGCGGAKAPVTEDFSDLAGLDSKSDAFSYRMKLLGSLDYGQTSDGVSYTKTPRFRAFKFAGQQGDQVDVWVRSPNGGDAVAWVLDNSYRVVAQNDDADGTTLDAHVTATLPANSDPSIVTYYVVFRDYGLGAAKFSVQLSLQNDFFACAHDADCVAVPEHICCPQCRKAAVNKDQQAAYESQALVCASHLCPIACVLDQRIAQCNTGTQRCEMVAVADIACGGFTSNAHKCPTGYDCVLPISRPDVPGICKASAGQFCGGIGNLPCPSGLTCVDDPNDSCDPSAHGADCGGICQ